MKTFAAIVLLLLLLASAQPLWAMDWNGTWVPRSQTTTMTMTIEPYGAGGSRIAYHIKMGSKEGLMVMESALDGSETPVMVDGKPTGETMAIKRLDDRHTFTVIKMNGQTFGTSKCEISADGKMLTVENTSQPAAPGSAGVKTMEIWDRK